MARTPIIHSHRARIAEAKDWIRREGLRCSIFDREALVEFLLLEQVKAELEHRMIRFKSDYVTAESQLGKNALEGKMVTTENTIKILTSVIEVLKAFIYDEQYSLVWKVIPEHVLMKAATNTKRIKELLFVVTAIGDDTYDKALEVEGVRKFGENVATESKEEFDAKRKSQDDVLNNKSPSNMGESLKESLEGLKKTLENSEIKPKDKSKDKSKDNDKINRN